MIPDDLRRKLEELNRGPLRADSVRAEIPAAEGPTVRLEEFVKGEIAGAPESPFFLIDRPLENLLDRAGDLTREFRGVWLAGRHALTEEELGRGWSDVIKADPQRLLFLDIETCGLTSTPLFLIGTMHLGDDGRFRLRQFFARDYTEEPHVLRHLARLIGDFDFLVTYNGKSFDWPYITDRAVYHAVPLGRGGKLSHLDLLHEARRRWKTVLPNCRLQTLEYHVSGRRRVGDIPGSLIPDAYHAYVKTGNARRMADVIHHNALDIITMVELMLFMLLGGSLGWE